MLKIREKAKINTKRYRFGLMPALGQDYMLIIDRDAEPMYTAEKGGRYVARVAKPYARALLALMNRGDNNGLLALKPAKRARKQRESHPDEGGSENP